METHSRNFPHALHINSRVDQANPGECPAVDLLFASPECTHHSRARGGRPTSDQQRSGAWDIMRWVEWHRPSYVVVENVREWLDWGPVGDNGRPLKSKRGHFFSAWVKAVEAAGYRVDHRILNAADFGAATSRERLFVVARKGNRYPVFPDATHGRRAGGELPGMGLHRWRCAAEVIDWTIPCRSVFLRARPLADKTLARIEAGLRRFVGPFVAQLRHENRARDPFTDPVPTLTTGGNQGLTVPFSLTFNEGTERRSHSIDKPLGTIRAAGKAHGLAVPFIVSYYGNGDAHDVRRPLPTVTTRDRCGLVYATVELAASIEPRSDGERQLIATMRELGVADIGFRMLSNPELAAAQGFPASYWFAGCKADVTKQIGNSVSPPVAEAITRAIA